MRLGLSLKNDDMPNPFLNLCFYTSPDVWVSNGIADLKENKLTRENFPFSTFDELLRVRFHLKLCPEY